jgi:hypothetical protein
MTMLEMQKRAEELDAQLAKMHPYRRARVWQRVDRELRARRIASESVQLPSGCFLIKPHAWHAKRSW